MDPQIIAAIIGGVATVLAAVIATVLGIRASRRRGDTKPDDASTEADSDLNIGNLTLRIGTMNGGVVNPAPPQQRRAPQPRPAPVMLLPRPFSGFLDRSEEVTKATAVLEDASPVEFHGPPGVGKTALLHYLAHHKFAPVFSSGIVFFSAIRHRPVDDLLLDFFDAFYDRDPTYLPTSVQVRHALREEHALVVLDDVDLEREDVEALMDAAPASVFLSASTEHRLWSGGRSIALGGLPSEEALALIEREVGRTLGEEDRTIVQQLCTTLEGYPLRLLQLSALVRDDGISLADAAERLQQHAGSVGQALTDQVLAQSSEPEHRVLEAMAVARGASIGEEHLSELAGVADARPALQSLQQRGLVEAHSPRYSLTGSLDEVLQEEWDLIPASERALAHFATWAEEQRHTPDRVLEEADAIMAVLQWATQSGRWAGALRLGRATEGPLAIRGRWGAWAEMLERELEAARQLGDRAAEAWSLHQSGTRALCLEDVSTARADLAEALRLRKRSGDEEGAAVTRHNLNLLDGLNGPRPRPDGDGRGWWGPRLWLGIIALVLILLLLGAVAVANEQPDIDTLRNILPWLAGDEKPGTPGGSNGGNEGRSQHPDNDGRGTASLDVSPASLNFGEVVVEARSEPTNVTLTSTGTGAIKLGEITIGGANAADFEADHTCSGKLLQADSKCDVSVTFSPSGIGARSAHLIIGRATQDNKAVSLRGTGTTIVPSPTSTSSPSPTSTSSPSPTSTSSPSPTSTSSPEP